LEQQEISLKERLDTGIIEPSASAWGMAEFMVPKKGTDKMRPVVDYQPLNKMTPTDAYPLPRIDDIFDAMGGAKYFSAVDATSGYWQIEMEPDDKEKTAFNTKHGKFHWTVMPFGLKNAPATFQQLMDEVLGPMKWKTAAVFINDICIFSKTFLEHMDHLQELFNRLREANLKLNPKKSHFMCQQVNLLGHTVSAEGIAPDQDKLQLI